MGTAGPMESTCQGTFYLVVYCVLEHMHIVASHA